MLTTHCAIAVAIEFLPKDKDLDLVRQNLAKAIALSAEYEKVWRSIIWVESSTSAKRRTRQRLNDIAFDVYTFLGAAFEDINVYANEQKKQNITPHPCWDKLIFKLSLAYDWIKQEHTHQIYSKQLCLL